MHIQSKFPPRLWALLLPFILIGTMDAETATRRHIDTDVEHNSKMMIEEGRHIFRYDTFGDEVYWGDTLHLHDAIKGEALGGVGPGVSPGVALDVGLKVDVQALPKDLLKALKRGEVDLEDPATTVELLRLNSVVGVQGFFDDAGLKSVGITCALCHAQVDDSFAPGIGSRLDGWANRDLNVGAIVALAPNLQPVADRLGVDVETVRAVLNSWGPGKYDAELNQDGKALRPDGGSAATLIPPAFGLAGVNLHTWNGWGSVTYWNAYVANTQMRGQGTFFDPRLNDPEKYPLSVASGDWNIRHSPDLVTSKLPALHFYQLAIAAPEPPEGSFDPVAAARGEQLFNTKAACAGCHVPPLYTEPGWAMHTAQEIGVDDFQALRSPDERYRTPPLKGLWTHTDGGFYHDGRFGTLDEVIQHYNGLLDLELNDQEINDLIQFLLSL
ncbi:MAG: c-type cytochrome [Caldilineaceae bacterium]|nr:c-type cytochrome [Caldilineaceae bacterium]